MTSATAIADLQPCYDSLRDGLGIRLRNIGELYLRLAFPQM